MKERIKNKNNIILGSLLAIVLLMAVGYAAFATNLNIGGSSSIDTSWDVRITNITTSNVVGGASNVSSSYDRLTANFSANLVSPGDSITYNITVANQGTLDAVLDSITNNSTTNEHIDVSITGITEGQVLYSNSTRVLKVVITFKDEELSGLTGTNNVNISLTLNYVQNTTNVTVSKDITLEYVANGGSSIDPVQLGLKDAIPLPTTYRLGYSFVGWNDKAFFGNSINPGTLVIDLLGGDSSKDSAKVYATWTAKNYTVHYDPQGGTSVSDYLNTWTSKSMTKATTWDGSEPYNFDGWYTLPNGQGMKIESNTVFRDAFQYIYGEGNDEGPNGEKEITLYANWV